MDQACSLNSQFIQTASSVDKPGIGPAPVRMKMVRTVEGEAAVGGVPDRVVLEVVRGAEAGEDK